jgi:hypothetical protein
MIAAGVDKWVKHWISEPRLVRYLDAVGGDESAAMNLYVWNGRMAAALLRDLADMEVLLRNRFNYAVDKRRPGRHWLLDPASPIRTPRFHNRNGERVDANAGLRRKLDQAIVDAGGNSASPGQVVAQLTFGFWRSLVSRRFESQLWTPYLSSAFRKPKPTRADVEKKMASLNYLRNRVAHHEHLLNTDISEYHADLLELCRWMSPPVADHIRTTTSVLSLLGEKP